MPTIRLHVLATPNAARDEIVGWEDHPHGGRVLRVRVAAPPLEGKANEALRAFLAKALGLSKSRVTLARGDQSRIKVFEVPEGTQLP